MHAAERPAGDRTPVAATVAAGCNAEVEPLPRVVAGAACKQDVQRRMPRTYGCECASSGGACESGAVAHGGYRRGCRISNGTNTGGHDGKAGLPQSLRLADLGACAGPFRSAFRCDARCVNARRRPYSAGHKEASRAPAATPSPVVRATGRLGRGVSRGGARRCMAAHAAAGRGSHAGQPASLATGCHKTIWRNRRGACGTAGRTPSLRLSGRTARTLAANDATA